MTGPYLRTDPGKCTSDQSEIGAVSDYGIESRHCSTLTVFVKIKMPKSACSVGNQNVEAGERERGSGEKKTSVAKIKKTLSKKNCIIRCRLSF